VRNPETSTAAAVFGFRKINNRPRAARRYHQPPPRTTVVTCQPQQQQLSPPLLAAVAVFSRRRRRRRRRAVKTKPVFALTYLRYIWISQATQLCYRLREKYYDITPVKIHRAIPEHLFRSE